MFHLQALPIVEPSPARDVAGGGAQITDLPFHINSINIATAPARCSIFSEAQECPAQKPRQAVAGV